MKNSDFDSEQLLMLVDVLLRVTALENLLMKKNILTNDEIENEITAIGNNVTDSLLKKTSKNNEFLDFLPVKKKSSSTN